MIVCKDCGHHNEDDDQFCGSCGTFLEWTGEKVEEPAPTPVAEAEPEPEVKKAGIVEKVKAAVGIEEDAERAAREEAEAAERAAREDAEAKAKAEAEARSRKEAELKARREAEERAKEEAEAKASAEAEMKARQEAEARAKKEAGAKDRAEKERKEREEAEAKANEEAEAKRREEADAQSLEEAERKAKERAEAEARAKKEAGAKDRAEKERKEREEAEAKANEEAEAKARAEKIAKAEQEQQRKAKEAAERKAREEKEAKEIAEKEAAAAGERQRRAAAILAKKPKPLAVETRAEEPAVTSAAQTAEAPTVQAEAVKPTPEAVKPGRPVKPVVPKVKTTPSREIQPGDLICGQCGEGNGPDRKFCRRCGNSLVEALVAKVPWYKKLFTRKKKVVEAGERPLRGKRRGGVGGARGAVSGARTLLNRVMRVAGILAILGVAVSFAVPSFRSVVLGRAGGLFGNVRQAVAPKFEPVRPTAAEATSSLPEHSPEAAIDQIKNTYWAEGAPGDGTGQTLVAIFDIPADLDRVGFTPGASAKPEEFVAQPRPKEIHLVFSDGSSKDVRLEDKAEFQSFEIEAKQVSRVEIHIVSVYGSLSGDACALAEVEFFSKG